MAQLFGCVCNPPERLSVALEPVRSALRVQGAVRRWGFAYTQAGHVLLSRTPRPAENLDFSTVTDGVSSGYIIGWTTDDPALHGTANTQPLRYRRWFFAQTETRASLNREPLLAPIPRHIQRNIRGKTDAEIVFHLYLTLLSDAGLVDHYDIEPSILLRTFTETLALIQSIEGRNIQKEVGNLIVSNGRTMIAARIGDEPLFSRTLTSQDPRLPEHERHRAIMAISSPIKPGDGFEAIPADSALVIHRQVESEIERLHI